MPVSCTHCRGTNIFRIRRNGWGDWVRASFGRWPYRCRDCAGCFHNPQRKQQYKHPAVAYTTPSETAQMAYRTRSSRPYAKILLQTETQAQMEAVLTALTRAVSSVSGTPKQHRA